MESRSTTGVHREQGGRMLTWFAALVTWWSTVLGVGDAAETCLVLGHLDALRARAFVEADPALLADVYASSELRDDDTRVLESWAERSLRLEGMGQHRSSCRVLDATDERVVLDVVDRLGPTRAVGQGRVQELPGDLPTRRTVTLTSIDGRWLVSGSR